MRKYAFATQVEENLYEIFDIKTFDESHEYQNGIINRIDTALSSENAIVSMKTSQFGEKAFPGGIWDGETFTNTDYPGEINYEESNARHVYSFLVNNIVFLAVSVPVNTTYVDLWDAAFDNNVILVPIPENETVSVGDSWNGIEFITQV